MSEYVMLIDAVLESQISEAVMLVDTVQGPVTRSDLSLMQSHF